MTPRPSPTESFLGWIIRLAGLFWLLGAFMLFRQIRMEMMLDQHDLADRAEWRAASKPMRPQ